MNSAVLAEHWAPVQPREPRESVDAFRNWRAECRVMATRFLDDERLAFARGFGVRVAGAWWRAIMGDGPWARSLRPPLQPFDTIELSARDCLLADCIGAKAAELTDDAAVYQIGLVYTAMLPVGIRGRLGAYYTPPQLAERVIDQVTSAGIDWARIHALDPACGGGAFLCPLASRMIGALRGRPPKLVVESLTARLHGWEIDPFAAWVSQVAMDAMLAPTAKAAGMDVPVLIEVRDSLAVSDMEQTFDLVVGNPPYGRTALDADTRQRYRRGLFGHANLYGLFTDMALQHCAAGGLIAFVTPTSFLAGQYFKNLRVLLAEEAPPVAIDFVAARDGVFDDVLQETLIAIYRRGGARRPISVGEIETTDDGSPVITQLGEADLPKSASEPWIFPRRPDLVALSARLSRFNHRLADWGWSVSTGPLVWNRHKDQLAEQPGPDRRPLIWAESVTSDGRFEFRALRRNHAPYFRMRCGDDWLAVSEPCVLLQRTTAKEQRRRLIAAALPPSFLKEHGAVVIENHLNVLRPIGPPAISASVLTAVLNSDSADRAFRCMSGSVAVSAFELEAMPLPASGDLAEIDRLLAEGAGLEAVEKACARLFGDLT